MGWNGMLKPKIYKEKEIKIIKEEVKAGTY